MIVLASSAKKMSALGFGKSTVDRCIITLLECVATVRFCYKHGICVWFCLLNVRQIGTRSD